MWVDILNMSMVDLRHRQRDWQRGGGNMDRKLEALRDVIAEALSSSEAVDSFMEDGDAAWQVWVDGEIHFVAINR